MSDEILINITPLEARVAVIEHGVLQEVFVERTCNRGLVGNIFKGKVLRVLPGMQAAFVDIGQERAGFIHLNELSGLGDGIAKDIAQLLHEGQTLIVQVAKDPIGTKGARLTMRYAIPSRYLVLMPHSTHVGVSLRIEDSAERDRLKRLVSRILEKAKAPKNVGFIVRTVAENVGEEALCADIGFLLKLWEQVQQSIAQTAQPSQVYEELSLQLRTLRDLVNPNIERILVDCQKTFVKIEKFVKKLVPHLMGCVKYYADDKPIFDLFGVEDEIQKALERRVDLKSGGYLVMDQREAMTTVDVNTGGYTGHKNLAETIFKTNLEAAAVIARHLRLRNLGGIIIIDFIDMDDMDHQRQVMRTLEKNMEKDHAKSNITKMTELGFVAMTRKRTRDSLENTLCEPCSCCAGRGTLKTTATVCYEIFREILREAKIYENYRYLVRASQEVIDRLLDEESSYVTQLEAFVGKVIEFQVEVIYNQEQFDVVLF